MPQQNRVTKLQQDQVTELYQNPSSKYFTDILSKSDRFQLQKFHDKMDELKYSFCPVCNKSFPSIVILNEECCHHCYNEKEYPKKFSAENNIDPGNVPEELQELSEIEEMLITRVFPVISVYRLREGQYGYCENVINFP